MAKNSQKTIAPKDVHALWLILKNRKKLDKTDFPELKKHYSATTKQIEEITQAGECLGLLTKTSSGWQVSPEGADFSKIDHWRFWKPKAKILSNIRTYELEHLFSQPRHEERPAVIDLFAGVGGLSLGFEAAGFDVVLAIDNDPEACEAHRKNFPWTVVQQESVDKIAANPKEYLNKIPKLKDRKIAGIIGGPPCQGFSFIGERVVTDERNLLTSRFMDTVLKLEPDFFVMENVPGLASSGIPPNFSVHIQRLAKSIGEPATILVGLLPKVPNTIAKRDKQYRKRLVSGVVTSFKDDLDENFDLKKFDLNSVCKQTSKSFKKLEEFLINEIDAIYANIPDVSASKIVRAAEKEIATISFSSVIEQLLVRNLIKDTECEEVLKAVASNQETGTKLRNAIKTVCEEYDASPKGKTMFGKKVGPILQHLIERAAKKYDITAPTVLNAAHFGAPQSRQRLFLIGVRKDLKTNLTIPNKTHELPSLIDELVQSSPTPTVFEAISDLPDIDQYETLIKDHEIPSQDLKRDAISNYAKLMRLEKVDLKDRSLPRPSWNPFLVDCCNRTLHADYVIERLKEATPGGQDKTSHKTRLHPDRPSCTLRAGTREAKGSHTAVRPVHYKHHRVISVREGGRLMGYPDWMTFHKTKWHGFRLVGNGVPFQLANAVGSHIFECLYGSKATKKQRISSNLSRAA